MAFGKHDKAVFLFNFDDGADLGADVSGFDRHGVASAVTQVASLDGKTNVAQFVPASDSGINLTTLLGNFSASSSLSFACWFRLSEIGPGGSPRCIWSASDNTQASREIILYVETTQLRFQIRNGSAIFQIIGSATLAANTWYHAAFSSGPAGAKLWLDKVSIGTNASTASISAIATNRCQIGYNVDSASGGAGREFEFNGYLKDCVLSAAELNNSTVADIFDNDLYSYEVMPLIGQSNEIGRADIVAGVDDDYSTVGGKVYQYGYNANARSAATNPLDHVNENAGDMGLWLAMCNALVPHLAYKQGIMVVPGAQGGTSVLTNWAPGGSPYETVLTRINSAMAYHAYNNMRMIHCLLGETDADNGNTATFQAGMEALYDDLDSRATGFGDTVPFVCVTIKGSTQPGNVALINAAMADFVAAGVERYLIDATDLNIVDTYHYDAPSLRTIGSRSASILVDTPTVLAMNDVSVASSLDSVVLVQAGVLTVNDVLLASFSDLVVLSADSVIDVADSALSVSVDSVVVNQANLLVVSALDVAVAAESPVLLQQGSLSIADARLSILMDSLTIGGGVFITESALGIMVRDFQYVLLVEA